VYNIYFKFEAFGYVIKICVNFFVHGALKVTVQTLFSDHKETQIYLQLATSRLTDCTAVLETVIHHV